MKVPGLLSRLLRLFSTALIDQAILSAGSFIGGLLLIRYTDDAQYGSYVLIISAVLLLTSLQNAFIGTPLVLRMPKLAPEQQAAMIGGLYREQRRWLLGAAVLAAIVAVGLYSIGVINLGGLMPVGGFLVAALATLRREYFRVVLLAYQRPGAVLRADVMYIVVMLPLIAVASFTPVAATAAAVGMAIAALLGARLSFSALLREQPWRPDAWRGVLREIAPLGAWAAAGGVIYWTFSQGYTYLMAGVLDVASVAAVAATRLLMMPINLLSTGIRQLLVPMASRWLHRLGPRVVAYRVLLFAIGLAMMALVYFLLLWIFRDWIFSSLLKKQFRQQDALLLAWSGIFLLTVVRDQLIYLLVVRERFKALTALSLVSAIVSLATSYWGMVHYAEVGALMGMLLGEIVNLTGVIVMVVRESNGPWDQGATEEAHA